jgi:hypothetical protein
VSNSAMLTGGLTLRFNGFGFGFGGAETSWASIVLWGLILVFLFDTWFF